MNEVKKQVQQGIAIPGVSNKLNETILIGRETSDILGSYKVVDCKNSEIELQKNTEILFLK